MKNGLIAALMLAVMGSAQAANWELVEFGSPDQVNFVDVDSIKSDRTLVYYWKKTLITGENDPYYQKYGERVFMVKTYAVDDCRNRIYKPIQTVVLDNTGATIDFYHNQEKPEPVGSWSKALELHQFVCSRKAQK